MRSFALVYVVVLVMVYSVISDPAAWAVGQGMPLWHSVTYQHIHASWIHVLCNAWVFLSVIFFWRPSVIQLLAAYVMSALFGILACCTHVAPTVGLSGLIYAMFGIYCLTPTTMSGLVRYQATALATMVVYCFFPGFSIACHALCYAMGVFYAIINYPIRYD